MALESDSYVDDDVVGDGSSRASEDYGGVNDDNVRTTCFLSFCTFVVDAWLKPSYFEHLTDADHAI